MSIKTPTLAHSLVTASGKTVYTENNEKKASQEAPLRYLLLPVVWRAGRPANTVICLLSHAVFTLDFRKSRGIIYVFLHFKCRLGSHIKVYERRSRQTQTGRVFF